MMRGSTAVLAALLALAIGLPGAGATPPEPADPWSYLPTLRLAAPTDDEACEARAIEVQIERRKDGGFWLVQRVDVAGCASRLAVDWPAPGSLEPTLVVRRGDEASFLLSRPCGEGLCFSGASNAILELRFDVRDAPTGLSLVLDGAAWGRLPEVDVTFAGRHEPTQVVVWQQQGSWQDHLKIDSGDRVRLGLDPEDRIGLVYDDRFRPKKAKVRPPGEDIGPGSGAFVLADPGGPARFAGDYRRSRRHGPWIQHHEHVPAVREALFDDGVLVSLGDWSYGAWRTMQGDELRHPDLVDCPEDALLEGTFGGDRADQWCRWTDARGEVQGGPWTTWHLDGTRWSQRTAVDGELQGEYRHYSDGQLDRIAMFADGQPVRQELGFEGGVLRKRVVHGPPVPGRDQTWWYPSGRKEILHQPVAGMGDQQRTLVWYPTGVLQQHCEPTSVDERWCWHYRDDGTLESQGPVVGSEAIDPAGRTPPTISDRPVVVMDVIEVPDQDVPQGVLDASAATRAVGATGAQPSAVYVADLNADGQADWLVRYATAFATVHLSGGPELVHAGEVMRVVDLHLRPPGDRPLAPICGMMGSGPDGIRYFCHDFKRGQYDMHGHPVGLLTPPRWRASCDDAGDCHLLVQVGRAVFRSDAPWPEAAVDCPGSQPCVPSEAGGATYGDLRCVEHRDQLACVLTHEAHLGLQRGWMVDLARGEVHDLDLPNREGPLGELVRVVGEPRWFDDQLELTIDDLGELRIERRHVDDWLVQPR